MATRMHLKQLCGKGMFFVRKKVEKAMCIVALLILTISSAQSLIRLNYKQVCIRYSDILRYIESY